MDEGYDLSAAGKRLEEIALDRYNSAHSGVQLSRIVSATAHYEAMAVGRNWNLVVHNTNEEVVVSFQGVIVKKDLPPFVERLGRASSHVKFLRQSVTIGGFNTATFARALDAIGDVHAVLGRAVGISNLAECGIISTMNDMLVVELSNRYLKPRHGGVANDAVDLTSDVDPHGYLAKAALSLGLYHSEDNVVQYFEREGSDDETYKYKTVKPLVFGIGDIVEIQASFVMYPLKDGKFKSVMVLRGLTLIDGSFTQASVKNRIVARLPAASPAIIKRKVGYGEETLSVTRAKLARMEIDQHQGEDSKASRRAGGEIATDVAINGGVSSTSYATLD